MEKYSDGEEETDLQGEVKTKVTIPNFETEGGIFVETGNKEDEKYPEESDRRYFRRKRHHTLRYGPILQVKRYRDGTTSLNFECTLGSPVTETDESEQIIGIIMTHQYILKSGLKRFGNKGERVVS